MLEICFFLELLTAGVFQVSVKSVLGSCSSCSLLRRYGRTRNGLSFCFRLFCLGSISRIRISLIILLLRFSNYIILIIIILIMIGLRS